MADIPFSDITSGYIDGDGLFDLLMGSFNSQLKKEYEEGRITGADYADVYLGSLQTVLQQTIIFLLGRQKADKDAELADANIEKVAAEVCLLNAKCLTEKAQTNDNLDIDGDGDTEPVEGLVAKQKNLYQKQADGFDRDAEQKALKLLVDLYSVAKSSDPDAITNFRWFGTTSAYTDELEKAISEAVENAGLSQILSNLT